MKHTPKIIIDAVEEFVNLYKSGKLEENFERVTSEEIKKELTKTLTQIHTQSKEEERKETKEKAESIMEIAICPSSSNCGLCLRGLRRKCDTANTLGLEEVLSLISNTNK